MFITRVQSFVAVITLKFYSYLWRHSATVSNAATKIKVLENSFKKSTTSVRKNISVKISTQNTIHRA